MNKGDNRYQKISDAMFQSWTKGDSVTAESLWAENATRLAVDPFDQNEPLRGRAAIIEALEAWKDSHAKILKNKILCSNSDYGIGNARAQWKGQDGNIWACDFIYKITLDSNDQCVAYQEWNVVRSKESS